jgi:hypothetical protein
MAALSSASPIGVSRCASECNVFYNRDNQRVFMMTTLTELFQTIDNLTPAQKQQILEYIERKQNLGEDSELTFSRVFDLHPNAMIMSDDFDDELPDSLWLGEAVKEN